MEPIEFHGQNIIFGEGQPAYIPLPAMKMPDGEVFTYWSISDEEIEIIKQTKCIYFKQLTFNQPLQPIRPMVDLSEGIEFL